MAALAVGCLSAPPDGTVTPDKLDAALTDAGELELVEVMEIRTDCSVESSESVLASGVSYRLVVSGLVTVGDELLCDADYFWNRNTPGDIRDLSNDVDLGVAIDDLEIDADRSPDWGEYRSDHRYQSDFTGLDDAINVQFHDTACGNNSGVFTLEIRVLPG